jgi:hypothetical protein
MRCSTCPRCAAWLASPRLGPNTPPLPLPSPPLQPPNFQFHDPTGPIYTSPRFLPPAKVIKSQLTDAIVSHGAYLRECTVNHAIIGLRSRVNEGVTIEVGGCGRGNTQQQQQQQRQHTAAHTAAAAAAAAGCPATEPPRPD